MSYDKVRSNIQIEFKMQTRDFDISVRNHGIKEAEAFISHMRKRLDIFEDEVRQTTQVIRELEAEGYMPESNSAHIVKALLDHIKVPFIKVGLFKAKQIVDILSGKDEYVRTLTSLRG